MPIELKDIKLAIREIIEEEKNMANDAVEMQREAFEKEQQAMTPTSLEIRAIQNGYMIVVDHLQQHFAKNLEELKNILDKEVPQLKAPQPFPPNYPQEVRAGLVGRFR